MLESKAKFGRYGFKSYLRASVACLPSFGRASFLSIRSHASFLFCSSSHTSHLSPSVSSCLLLSSSSLTLIPLFILLFSSSHHPFSPLLKPYLFITLSSPP